MSILKLITIISMLFSILPGESPGRIKGEKALPSQSL